MSAGAIGYRLGDLGRGLDRNGTISAELAGFFLSQSACAAARRTGGICGRRGSLVRGLREWWSGREWGRMGGTWTAWVPGIRAQRLVGRRSPDWDRRWAQAQA
jgi:hypothetical protein